MKELFEYREKLIVRLGEATGEFCQACRSFEDPFTKVEGEWTLHQVASHIRDVDQSVYGKRIRQTLDEENPHFKSFNADTWMAEHYDKDEPLAEILSGFSANIDGLCKLLKTLPQKAWSRESRHETMGGALPMQLWVERSLAHIEEHLQTLKKAEIP